MKEVRKVIDWYGQNIGLVFDVSEDLVGGIAYDTHGTPLHDATCLLYTSPSPRDRQKSRMPSSA